MEKTKDNFNREKTFHFSNFELCSNLLLNIEI